VRKKGWLFVLLVSLVWAGNAAGQERKSFLVGIMVPYNSIGGSDFSGDNYFDLGTQLVFLPKIQSALGWGIIAGFGRDSFDAEVYYMHSSHDAQFLDVKDTVTLNAFGLDFRWYLMKKPGIVRPYLNTGADFSFLTASSAAVQVDWPYYQGDAKFIGLGLFGGGGLALSPIDRIVLFVGAEVRWNPMGKVKGYEGNYETTKDLDSLGICLRSGLGVRF
jgi:hypothetical protein